MMPTKIEEMAFPILSDNEIEALRPFATAHDFADGEYVFKAGQAEIDLFIVESGKIDILNPADHDRHVATHEAGAFSGDIDLLTRRPPLVHGVARGPTRVLRVPGGKLREVVNRIPRFGEKLMTAFTTRREMLTEAGAAGVKVIGPGHCKDTALVREFLYKNFVPFSWADTNTPAGREAMVAVGSPKKTPVIICGDGRVLLNPTLHELARSAGIWQACPDQNVDLAIVGAGPAGISAAVYAASEGLSTVVLDRLGPGG